MPQACLIGCQTGPTTGNLADTCFSGVPPLVLSTNNTLGGHDVTMIVTLEAGHLTGAIVNSSSGAKTKRRTPTLGAATSVAANVQ